MGSDPENHLPRLLFSFWDLFDGLPLPPVTIGMLAIWKILHRLSESHCNVSSTVVIAESANSAVAGANLIPR